MLLCQSCIYVLIVLLCYFVNMETCVQAESARIYRQIGKDMNNEQSKKLQENVDKVAMYLFPLIFVVFNCIYWPYYTFFIYYSYL